MKLIFLLGNTGSQYRDTRHNIAWDIVDSANLEWSEQTKFRAYLAQQTEAGNKVLYARPTTYYNLAGQSLRSIMDFYKIAIDDVLIVHDDLMLPLGTIRARIGGSDAGNNGMKSIVQHVGEDIARIRIGIASPQRSVMGDSRFVLAKFNDGEKLVIEQLRPRIAELIKDFITDSFTATTYRHQTDDQD